MRRARSRKSSLRGRWISARVLLCSSMAVATTAVVAVVPDAAANAATSNSITVAVSGPPISLDPSLDGNSADQILMHDLAYEPLIELDPDGSLSPGLATSWKYMNSSLTVFDLTLRSGVRFSDGESLTAAAVVASIKRYKTSLGPGTQYVQDITSASAVGPLTVQLDLSRGNPLIALLLTQRFLTGDIIGPKGTADPKILGTSTDGAGPDELDAASTIAGSKYVYVPNPYFFDPSAVHFNSFTVDVVTNPQTALNELEAGTIAYADGSYISMSAAQSAGLKIYPVESSIYGLWLFDRQGALVPALKSQLVREALSYAIDRPAIAEALFGKYGLGDDEISLPGYQGEGYVPSYRLHYAYNLSRAKELLKEAGYPNGFSMNLGATSTEGDGIVLAEAVAADWAKVGVTVSIKSFPSIPAMVAAWSAKQIPALAGSYDGQPMYIEAGQLLSKNAGIRNNFMSTNPQLMSDIAAAYAASSAASIAHYWSAVEEDVVNLGWEFPVLNAGYVYFSAKNLQGVAVSPTSFAPDPTRWHD